MADHGAELDQDDARLLVGLVRQLDHHDTILYTDVGYARALRQKVLYVSQRVLGDQDLDTVIAMNDLAVLLWAYGDFPEARVLQERVLELSRLIRGEENVDTLTAMMNLRDTLVSQGDWPGAQALMDRINELGHRATGTRVLRNNPP